MTPPKRTPIEWHPETRQDIDRPYQFLFDHNPATAERFIRTVMAGATLLAESPRLGRPMADDTARHELFMPFGGGQYVLRYKLTAAGILVLRVWHSREQR